jgi:hypothetical protein
MPKQIQRVELTTFYHLPIHCPFCGAKVTDNSAASGEGNWATPCAHTLFVAHDEAFEFRSDRFNKLLELPDDHENIALPDKGIDGLTDSVWIDDAVKFAAYVGPPSFYGSYVGFAPLDEE